MTLKSKSTGNFKQSRFSLTITNPDDAKVIDKFKDICKKQKKRYTTVALSLFREYIDDYKASR